MQGADEVAAADLEEALRSAVLYVYRHHADLIRERAHERSVVFHIGRHLAQRVEDWGADWQVDVDYNRAHDHHALERVKKYLPATPGRIDGSVFPDLIVHHRSVPQSENPNLLVLEAKYAPVNRVVDYGKLHGYRVELHYRVAAFLEFARWPAPPKLMWSDAMDQRSATIPDPTLAPPPMW